VSLSRSPPTVRVSLWKALASGPFRPVLAPFLATAAGAFVTAGLGDVYLLYSNVSIVWWGVVPAGIVTLALASFTVWLVLRIQAREKAFRPGVPPTGL